MTCPRQSDCYQRKRLAVHIVAFYTTQLRSVRAISLVQDLQRKPEVDIKVSSFLGFIIIQEPGVIAVNNLT